MYDFYIETPAILSHVDTRKPGVYEIYNKANGKRYIGSSENLRYRLRNHIRRLRKGTHGNKHLQSAWTKYGEENFTIDVVHTCPKDMTLVCEQWVIDQYDFDTLYNNNRTTKKQVGYKHSAETRSKMHRMRTPEHRRNLSAALKGRVAPNRGMPISDAQREAISNTLKEHYKNKPMPWKGKQISEEHRRKLSEAAKRRHQNNK